MTAYSFMDVTASLAGATGVVDFGYGTGIAEGGIKITANGDKNTMTIGADGSGMHSLHADKSGQVTVSVLKTSPLNAKLMAMYSAQSMTSAAWGGNTLVIRQVTSGDTTSARQCAFKKVPDIAYAKDGDTLEWVFDSVAIDKVLGTY